MLSASKHLVITMKFHTLVWMEVYTHGISTRTRQKASVMNLQRIKITSLILVMVQMLECTLLNQSIEWIQLLLNTTYSPTKTTKLKKIQEETTWERSTPMNQLSALVMRLLDPRDLCLFHQMTKLKLDLKNQNHWLIWKRKWMENLSRRPLLKKMPGDPKSPPSRRMAKRS